MLPNADGTFKLELFYCKFKDIDGEELSGTVIFPRVSKTNSNSFKIEDKPPTSGRFTVIIDEK